MKEWTKSDLIEMSSGYWQICTLHTGVKLDLFSLIGSATVDAGTIAAQIKATTFGVETLMNALCAMDLLIKKNGRYANTEFSLRYLVTESSDYTGFIIGHHNHLMDSWHNMSESILSGKPYHEKSATFSETERENFLMGMFNMAMGIAPRLVKEIDLSAHTRFLDFGGGPGTYAIHFCLQNPQMTATVFDLPTTRMFAEKTITRFNLTDRISFREGSYTDDCSNMETAAYDVAWISHNLHGEAPQEAEKIIAHAMAALKPGGVVFIHEFIMNNDKTGPLFAALFSVNMLLQTEGGRAYSEQELITMLEKNGARDVKRLDTRATVTSGIISGRKAV